MPDITAEYRIIETGAGVADRSGRGRIRFEGADVRTFLQNLVTNDLAPIDEGRGIYACLLTPQGRMVADFRFFQRGAAVLADVTAGTAAAVVARLDALVFAEDVRVSDVTPETSMLSVVGAGAARVLEDVFEVNAGALAALQPLGQLPTASGSWITRSDETTRPMYDVWLPASDRDVVWNRLLGAGALPVSPGVLDVLRIEAGRPAFGVDMTSETIPLEAGLLDRAISTTKGCYVGQEVIIRVLHRGGGRVARRLVRMEMADAALGAAVSPGDRILLSDREIGKVTSVGRSADARVVALGYVARDHAVDDTRVEVEAGGSRQPAAIIGLAG